ncbi:MAG: hypothetical protein IIW20_00385 [Clostridia bacterium]|nr:hypothetical protein [Clostridia bacterium]
MKRESATDEFFSDQPELSFIKDLTKPYHELPVAPFGKRTKEKDEFSVDGLYLVKEFPDENGLLDTAYADFEYFTDLYKIDGKKFPVITKKVETSVFEEYYLEITEDKIIISANDTEGIRRGIYLLEDEIKASEAPFLKKDKIHKTPRIRKRITRGFFSPTNRPPKNGDELSDDIDYYPEEYLNRLAHDGTNGLWIYTKFFDIIPSSVIPEYGQGYEKRIEKLNRVCERCEKYGIGVYVFAIEPALPPKDIRDKYKDIIGGGTNEFNTSFCTHTERGKKFCIEATKKLCELVPKLTGFMSITAGERPTSCGGNRQVSSCPYCGHKTIGQSLGHTLDCLKEGLRQSGRDVEFISWTYGHRGWAEKDIAEYVEYAPDDVMLMQNFEEVSYVEQLGKTRKTVDYWLAYPGPSDMFNFTADAAHKYNKHLYAKMQICCSHDLATLPYIPTPGIIFDKIKGAVECGVEGIVECWYFGNYPSIMSRAASEFSFCDDFSDKDASLLKLASAYCGKTNAPKLLEAWRHFEKGYKNYPLNIMFSYYGPMHDGIAWDLHVKPKNFAPPRSWLLLDKPDGDRIRDCLFYGHTLEEAITLLDMMRAEFKLGMAILEKTEVPAEHNSVTHAMNLLVRSASNILNFYKKREMIAEGEGDALTLLSEMKAITEEEIENSLKMATLCENDGRLGYHSEAEGYKFFPKKLLKRVESLKALLVTEFPETEARIKDGLSPFEYYLGIEDDAKHYDLIYGNIKDAEWELLDDGKSKFRVSYDDVNLYIQLVNNTPNDGWNIVTPEFKLFHNYTSIKINADGITLMDEADHQSLFGERGKKILDNWKFELSDEGVLLTANRNGVGWTEAKPMKMRVLLGGCALWDADPTRSGRTLGKSCHGPAEFGWLMPKKKD